MTSLIDRKPIVDASSLINGFVPPARFSGVRFSNYIPNHSEPSQANALLMCSEFVKPQESRSMFGKKSTSDPGKSGIYLDGGFGVGKTHLLASIWHETHHRSPGSCAYASFVEMTNAVGALGFAQTVAALSNFDLVCIDEFELDDPGDTVLMSSLVQALVDQGVRFAVTSNTLPDKLGEGRFAADDFIREIQGLRNHFDVVRIDGPDFRHRDEQVIATLCVSLKELDELARTNSTLAYDNFTQIDSHLVKVHPSSYGALVDGVSGILVSDVQAITNQAHALRWVAFIDKIYDREIPVRSSGVEWIELFSPEMLKGGYRKKYLRALSRITALAQAEI